MGHLGMQPGKEGADRVGSMLQNAGAWSGEPRLDMSSEGALLQPFYTIQRVNGSAIGDDGMVGDGTDGRHKHTLEESDRVKKNSVIRASLKDEKEKRKSSGSLVSPMLFRFRVSCFLYSLGPL